MEYFLIIASSFWFQAIIKLILGFVLAGIIGLERDSWNKPAGFRTHALLGLSSVLIMLCGEYMSKEYSIDPSRIPAQLLSGIGFIGAGTILRDGVNVKGLTTAAGLLAVTCIGLSIGAGFYLGGILATLLVYIVLSYSYKVIDSLDHFNALTFEIKISKDVPTVLKQIETMISENYLELKHIKRSNNSDSTSEGDTITLTINYNTKTTDKNKLLTILTSIKNVEEVTQI